VKLEDAIADESRWSVRRQNWKVDGRRKRAVDWKVQPDDAMSDEELEVGPKVKPEEAVSDASRKLV